MKDCIYVTQFAEYEKNGILGLVSASTKKGHVFCSFANVFF